MKLINTDGMAFIGPESEWLWTALTFVTLSVTFIAIYRQLKAQQLQLAQGLSLRARARRLGESWVGVGPGGLMRFRWGARRRAPPRRVVVMTIMSLRGGKSAQA